MSQHTVLTDPSPFDLLGPLPSGTSVLEASAGTGKTYAITALAVRYLAEGHFRLDEIMMVTFSRAATSELRHRVYTRLRETRAALAAHLAEGSMPTDRVDAHLVAASPEEVALRLERVDAALAEIDAATIATTHEFCQRMLTGLGLLVDHDQTVRFADNVDDLVQQVVQDAYLAREVADASDVPPSKQAGWKAFREVGLQALREVELPLVPEEVPGLSAARVDFARQVRADFEARKRRGGIYTFDDMVARLRDALTDPVTGELAARTLSERYPLVLIDEFQDTDPTQWQIVHRAFVGRSTVVLIGDPKQAIYAFRGADVNAYLDAVAHADALYTLDVNHRSDEPVVRGVLEVFAGAAMGSQRIVVRDVQARHKGSRIEPPFSPVPREVAPVQVRCIRRPARGEMSATRAERAITADLVNEVVGLLADGWQVDQGGEDGWRRLQPSDIAVLVRANRRGEQIRDALATAGVSAVFGGASSVMTSEAAMAWLDLLHALTEPSNPAMKRAALGCLIGWSEQELAAASRDQATAPEAEPLPVGRSLPELAVQVKLLGRVLDEQGVAAVFEALCDQTNLYRRLLARPDGERLMTDVRHVAQLLNEAAERGQLGSMALAEWLADRVNEAQGSRDDDRTRRLETDASCVQIMTIHGAKGLEFPVVLLPEAANEWERPERDPRPIVGQLNGRRVLDVGVDGAWARRREDYRVHERAESLRTLYVAMTRAKSRLVMWWAPTRENTAASPLHRLLHGPRRPGVELDLSYPLPEDPRVPLDRRLVEMVLVDPAEARRREARPQRSAGLVARSFTREVDTTWRRTSYSGLTHEVHGVRMASAEAPEQDEVELDDEAATPPAAVPAGSLASALGPLPGGTQFGSLVHGVLETVDPTSASLEQDLASRVDHLLARLPVDGLDAEALVQGLAEVLRTPLGPLADDLRLCDIPVKDRLAELDFELPMGGPGGEAARLRDIAAALQDGALTGGDDFAAAYGRHLAESPVADKTLRGFLTGSIDAVLRIPDGGGQRFLVVDYKTNRIPVAEGEELSALHYTPAAMGRAMVEAHYPLQALLYAVALHRFLGWRLPGYRPEQHLGATGYLFVRGMAGADTPTVDGMPCGVFTWHPSAALVAHVSRLLEGR
ncbi:UvrD-helicase domain-containing protein [Luteococcus peritonei]|uniref:RecBCD enzyme subunit RecB n=1 Tax=Luteococcus peritonei TaxID=88874 RepID=A0ABW4RWN5_9ACTN